MTDERPTQGGSYLRMPDGSLKLMTPATLLEHVIAGSDLPVATVAPSAPKPTKSRRTKE